MPEAAAIHKLKQIKGLGFKKRKETKSNKEKKNKEKKEDKKKSELGE
jgi:hypothetical protein